MLLIKVTDAANSGTLVMTHEVKNPGKVTEEHHIRFHLESGSVNGKPLAHYVLGKNEAKELKVRL